MYSFIPLKKICVYACVNVRGASGCIQDIQVMYVLQEKKVSKECTNFFNLDSLKNGIGGRIYLFLFSLNFVLTSIASVLLCFPFPVGFNRER